MVDWSNAPLSEVPQRKLAVVVDGMEFFIFDDGHPETVVSCGRGSISWPEGHVLSLLRSVCLLRSADGAKYKTAIAEFKRARHLDPGSVTVKGKEDELGYVVYGATAAEEDN